MKLVYRVLLVLLATLALMIGATTAALCEQSSHDITVSAYQASDSFSMTSGHQNGNLIYGKTSLGKFSVSGNTNDYAEYMGVPAIGVESGVLSFNYDYNGSYLEKSDTTWFIAEDGSKSVDGINLDAKIKRGVLIVQKSSDRKTWVDATNPEADYFASHPGNNRGFYTTDGGDLARGTFYRIILAYKMQKKTGENRFVVKFSDKYDDAYCIETYEFYACVNTATISLHSMATDVSTISAKRTCYETDGAFKFSGVTPVTKLAHGATSVFDITLTGQFSQTSDGNGAQVYNLARGGARVSFVYAGKMLSDSNKNWRIAKTNASQIDGAKIDATIGKGILLVQYSTNGKDYNDTCLLIANVFEDNPRGIESLCELYEDGYYRIIGAYQTEIYSWTNVFGHEYMDTVNNVEVFSFQLKQEGFAGIDLEAEGYSMAMLDKGETLTNNATTTRGFIVDKLGTNYTVNINGQSVSDGHIVVENGRYDVEVITPLNRTSKMTVYVYRDDDDCGASAYFQSVPISGKRVFNEGTYPTYDASTALRLLSVSDQMPALTGVLTNKDTGEEITIEGTNRAEQTYPLNPGSYHGDFYSGNTESGSVYHYELNFDVIADDAQPHVNYDNLMSADRLSDKASMFYQVAYQTTRGGYIFVCFADLQHANEYAYEIEKRFVEDGWYKSLDNPNVKVKYSTSGEGLIELTQALYYYAEQNVEIAFFNPAESFTYRTLDDPEQLSNLEALSLPESVKVIPSEEERERMYLRQPFLNGFTFIQAADYDVVEVSAFCKENGQTYPLSFGIPVDDQLSVSSEYIITEKDVYGDTRSYSAVFLTENRTTVLWETASDQATSIESRFDHNDAIEVEYIRIVQAQNPLDDNAIVVITPTGSSDRPITCLVSDLPGLTLTQKGTYTFKFYDRIGHSFEQVVRISGGSTSVIPKGTGFSYQELYNKVHIQKIS